MALDEVQLATIRKLDAEARLARANAEQVELTLEGERGLVQNTSKTNKDQAESQKAAAEARTAEIEAQKAESLFNKEQAKDEYHHVYQFGGKVSETTVNACIAKLSEWSRLAPECEIEIVFNSGGGSVIDGFALYDFLISLRAAGHLIVTVARGMAASMAGILLQAGDVRVIGSESVLLVHEISFGANGKIGEVEDTVDLAKILTKRVMNIFVGRTHLTARQLDTKWKRKDWFMDSSEALKLGFVDEIR